MPFYLAPYPGHKILQVSMEAFAQRVMRVLVLPMLASTCCSRAAYLTPAPDVHASLSAGMTLSHQKKKGNLPRVTSRLVNDIFFGSFEGWATIGRGMQQLDIVDRL